MMEIRLYKLLYPHKHMVHTGNMLIYPAKVPLYPEEEVEYFRIQDNKYMLHFSKRDCIETLQEYFLEKPPQLYFSRLEIFGGKLKEVNSSIRTLERQFLNLDLKKKLLFVEYYRRKIFSVITCIRFYWVLAVW